MNHNELSDSASTCEGDLKRNYGGSQRCDLVATECVGRKKCQVAPMTVAVSLHGVYISWFGMEGEYAVAKNASIYLK